MELLVSKVSYNQESIRLFTKLILAKWDGARSGGRWVTAKSFAWVSVCSLGCLSERNRHRIGSNITIDTYTANYSSSSDSTAIAEMILVLQMATCGQFLNRGTIALINFPNLLLRYELMIFSLLWDISRILISFFLQ